jgi:plastocyanin
MKRSSVGLAAVVASALFALAATAQAGEIKGKVTVQGIKSAEDIVVYVDEIPGRKFDAPKEHALINQIKMKFEPHILVVQQGTTVDFLNSDSVGHNVYWPSVSRNRKLAHNMGTWPKGQKKSFEFNDVGAAPLLCNVHPEMSGYVVVVPTPYFGVTDSDGAFEIKNVPAGKYTLTTWSEDGKPTTQAVEVGAGTATIELTVKK